MSIAATLANNGALYKSMSKAKAIPLAYASLYHHLLMTNPASYGSRSISTVSQPRNQSPSTVKHPYSSISPSRPASRNVSRHFSSDYYSDPYKRGIIKFSALHRKDIKKIKKNPVIRWKKIKCPRQSEESQDCGYYVCRYIIEYIHGISNKTYPQELIDDLRDMWVK